MLEALVTTEVTPPTFDFSGVVTLISSFAAAYSPVILTIFGVGLGIAALVWGYPRLVGLFKKSAK